MPADTIASPVLHVTLIFIRGAFSFCTNSINLSEQRQTIRSHNRITFFSRRKVLFDWQRSDIY